MIDSVKLEDLIHETYGKSFSIAGEFEASNGSVHHVEVPEEVDESGRRYAIEHHGFITFEEWLASDDNSWRAPQPLLQDVVNDLHQRGLIPEGRYWLHVWW
jgi:hypothetical protein